MPYRLSSDSISVEFCADQPGVAVYRDRQGAALRGGGEDGFRVVLLDEARGAYRSTRDADAATTVTAEQGPAVVDYTVVVKLAGADAGRLSVRFELSGAQVRVTSRILEEAPGFQIASVFVGALQVSGDQPNARLVLPSRSGRLVRLADAVPESETHRVEWFAPVPVAMALDDRLVAVLLLDSIDNQIVHEVTGPTRTGTLTAELIHRHRVAEPGLSFLAQEAASCTVHVVSAPEGEQADWPLGAALVREAIPANLNDLYTGALVYKVMLQAAGSDRVTTYDDALRLIRRVRRLTGGARQVVYLVGWQHAGHDTGYPDVFTANPRVGTFEDFRRLKEAAREENAVVSVHDNYHDAYMDSPLWDPAIVARDLRGDLKKGGVWGGGQAYEIGPAKYADRAAERAARTVEMLGLERTTHLDVMSDKPDMVDFDPAAPAMREQNAAGKRRMVAAYNRLGIDVTSEVLTCPFTGCMSHFWHVERRPVETWRQDERIPLVPMLYHGKVTAGGDASTDAGKLDQIEYGWTFSDDWTKETPDETITDLFYLVGVPWSLLATRQMAGFRRDGDVETVSYAPLESETFVKVNRAMNRYQVVVDGCLVARDFATFAPLPDGRIAVYSRAGGTMHIDGRMLPTGGGTVTDIDGKPGPELAHSAGGWTLEMPPRTPCFVEPAQPTR